MTTEVIQHIYKLKRGTEQKIFELDPILLAGEPLVVLCDDDIVRLKIGDGIRSYNDLPFINQENDQSLKRLVEEVKLLKQDIHNAGDVVYRVDGSELVVTKGSSISEKITNYLLNLNPIDRFMSGNVAIVKTRDDRYSEGFLLEIYVYDGREWLLNTNTYIVDSNSVVLETGVIKLRGFDSAKDDTIPLKEDGTLTWKPVDEVIPINGVLTSDKFLSVENKKLECDIKIAYKSTTNELLLLGKDDTVVSTIDASNILVDNMLDRVDYDDSTDTLTFTWNTANGKEYNSVKLTNILDPYFQGSGIDIDVSRNISIHLDDSSENFISLSDKGLKLSGVQQSIDTALDNAKVYTDDSIRTFTETYITGADGTLEKLQEIADWINDDESGTAKIISDVATNTTNISNNTVAISKNAENIARHEAALTDHTTTISEHTTTISTHTTDIDNNKKSIDANKESIARLGATVSDLSSKEDKNTTYEFTASDSPGAFKVRASDNIEKEVNTGAKEYTDQEVQKIKTDLQVIDGGNITQWVQQKL